MRAWLLLALVPGCLLEDRTFEATDAGRPADILVTMEDVQVPEDERAIVSVTLERPPGRAVTVSVRDDASIVTRTEPSAIVFDDDSWDITKEIEIHALPDDDLDDAVGAVVLSAAGHDSTWIDIEVLDDDVQQIEWLGPAAIDLGEGSSVTVSLRLAYEPDFGDSVSVTSDGDLEIWPTIVGFNSLNYATPQQVELTAPEDADTLDEAITLTAMLAGAPSATITVMVVDDD